MVFECRHNIRKQPISKAIPYSSSFHNITTIGTHQHLGEILKDVFSFVFSRQYGIYAAQANIILSPLSLVFIGTRKN